LRKYFLKKKYFFLNAFCFFLKNTFFSGVLYNNRFNFLNDFLNINSFDFSSKSKPEKYFLKKYFLKFYKFF